MDLKKIKEEDMIHLIYQLQGEKIDEILKRTNKKLKDKLKKIDCEKIIKNSDCKRELKEIFTKIEDNYNMKITEYNEEMYKQGFIDGVNLILNCLKN